MRSQVCLPRLGWIWHQRILTKQRCTMSTCSTKAQGRHFQMVLDQTTSPNAFVTAIQHLTNQELRKIDSKKISEIFGHRLSLKDDVGFQYLFEKLQEIEKSIHIRKYSSYVWLLLENDREEDALEVLEMIKGRNCGLAWLNACDSFVHYYARKEELEKAKDMLEQMQSQFHILEDEQIQMFRSAFSVLIQKYCHRHAKSAFELFDEMVMMLGGAGVMDYTNIFRACERSRANPRHFIELFDSQQKSDNQISPTGPFFMSMIASLLKSDELQMAVDSLARMKEAGVQPNEKLYVHLMKACGKAKEYDQALAIYEQLLNSGQISVAGFGCIINICKNSRSRVHLSEVLHDIRDHKWNVDTQACNDALFCYAKNRDYTGAGNLFAELLDVPVFYPNEKTLLAMLESAAGEGLDEAMRIVACFKNLGIHPNRYIYGSLLSICAQHEDVDAALKIYERMQSENISIDLKSFTSLALCFIKDSALFTKVIQDMSEDDIHPDLRFFDSLLSAALRVGGSDKCYQVLHLLQSEGIPLSGNCFYAVIRTFQRARLYGEALDMFYEMQCNGHVTPDLSHLRDILLKCSTVDDINSAHKFLRVLSADDLQQLPQDVFVHLLNTLKAQPSRRQEIRSLLHLAKSAGCTNIE